MKLPVLHCASCGGWVSQVYRNLQQPFASRYEDAPVRAGVIQNLTAPFLNLTSQVQNQTLARNPVIPRLKAPPTLLGLAQDPELNRDSCGSSQFGDRVLWTCRDTQFYNADGTVQEDPLISSTGSWSDYGYMGGPALHPLPAGGKPLNTTVLTQYGENGDDPYFPLLPDECASPAGGCSDGTRYAIWPDQPPMVVDSTFPVVVGYTWIKQSHIRKDFSEVTPNPATTLYRVEYDVFQARYGDREALPNVTVVASDFYKQGEIPYGNYGNVVYNGTAYLYANINGDTTLARVRADSVEDRSKYSYYVDGTWTTTQPKIGQSGLDIASSNAGGQGTYYYSKPWQSFVWIGGDSFPGARMYVATAPAPEGPWTQPKLFYQGPEGDFDLSAYSIQAHPGLNLNPWANEIYVTYTKNDLDKNNVSSYTTPLVYVQWEWD